MKLNIVYELDGNRMTHGNCALLIYISEKKNMTNKTTGSERPARQLKLN